MNRLFGSPSPEGAPSQIDQEISREQFRMVLSMTTPSVVMGSAFAVIAAGFIYSKQPHPAILIWLLTKLLWSGVLLWHRHRPAAHQTQLTHQKRDGALLLVDSLIWGLSGWLAAISPGSTTLLIAITLAGVATMATFSLQAHWHYALASCTSMMTPAILACLSQSDPIGQYIGLALLVFGICLLTVSLQSQKRIQEFLRQRFTNSELANQREAQLHQAQQQMTEKAQFMATMSHELRTPLHGMLGLTRMLQAHLLPESERHRLSLVERSGEHLLSVINNILDFSRIEAGHLETAWQAFDLHALLSDVLALNKAAAQSKPLHLRLDLPSSDEAWVMGDEARVRQILLNLVGNAVKFTDQGWIRISATRLSAGANSPSGAMHIRVEDTGVGISPNQLEHIFTPFAQASNGTRQRIDGTGLGLTIARALAHAMQGDLTCHSALGQGTTFKLTLPLPVAERVQWPVTQPATYEAEPAELAHAPSISQARCGKVLLAEDNEVNAMIVDAVLRRQGWEVEHHLDGETTVDAACRHGARPDVILMDCMMPRLDGLEATRLIRQEEARRGLPRLPVIALTASALQEDHDRCLAAGMDAYLAKPFTESQLLTVLAPYGATTEFIASEGAGLALGVA